MDWILDHLQFIIAFAGVVAYWLNQRRREKSGEEADYDGDGIPENRPVRRKLDPNEPDPEEAERARQIQDEIRRKILERRSGNVPVEEPPPLMAPARPATRPVWAEPTEAPRPAAGGPMAETLRRMIEQVRDPEAEARAAAAEQAARDRHRLLQEQLDAIEEQRLVEMDRAAAVRRAQATLSEERDAKSSRGGGTVLLEALRDPSGLRQAVVVREILGAPVGLR